MHITVGQGGSALQVVGVGGATALPSLFIGPWGGVLGDRLDRRKMIIATQSCIVVITLGFGWLVKLELVQVWHVYTYALISGSCQSITMPLRHALIANTVPRHIFPNAYAANVLTIPGTRLLGPFMGGLIISNLGFFWPFALECILGIAVILALTTVRARYVDPQIRTCSPMLMGMHRDMVDGMLYVWKHNRIILLLLAISLVPNVIVQPTLYILPLFTAEVLESGPDIGGYMMAMNGFGGLIGALYIASFGITSRRGIICLITTVVSCCLVLLFTYSISLPTALLVIAGFGATQTCFRTISGTLIQTLTEDQYRGRVTSFQRISQGIVIGPSLFIGWFTSETSVRWAICLMALTGLTISIPFTLFARGLRSQE